MKTVGKKKTGLLTVILLTTSVVLTATGLILGQYRDVFNKAIKICVECMGFGK